MLQGGGQAKRPIVKMRPIVNQWGEQAKRPIDKKSGWHRHWKTA
ncbi:MAG: hypothetical protein RBU37_12625 [Myxococcota bacterium]|nr:hypothetical protein [Myxococcota bacterium]